VLIIYIVSVRVIRHVGPVSDPYNRGEELEIPDHEGLIEPDKIS
jgi:hypothetical protein